MPLIVTPLIIIPLVKAFITQKGKKYYTNLKK